MRQVREVLRLRTVGVWAQRDCPPHRRSFGGLANCQADVDQPPLKADRRPHVARAAIFLNAVLGAGK